MPLPSRYLKVRRVSGGSRQSGWYLEWGEDLSRFKDGKHFGSYTGLTCSEYSTGETIRKGHITHQGHRQVRGWLIECAWMAKSRDPVLLDKYNSVLGSMRQQEESHCSRCSKVGGPLMAMCGKKRNVLCRPD